MSYASVFIIYRSQPSQGCTPLPLKWKLVRGRSPLPLKLQINLGCPTVPLILQLVWWWSPLPLKLQVDQFTTYCSWCEGDQNFPSYWRRIQGVQQCTQVRRWSEGDHHKLELGSRETTTSPQIIVNLSERWYLIHQLMVLFNSYYFIITGTTFSDSKPLWSCNNAWDPTKMCRYCICNSCYKLPEKRVKRKRSSNVPPKCNHNEISTLQPSYAPNDMKYLHDKHQTDKQKHLPTKCSKCRRPILINQKEL